MVGLAHENNDWVHGKIQGECGKLGHVVSAQTIANLPRPGLRQDEIFGYGSLVTFLGGAKLPFRLNQYN